MHSWECTSFFFFKFADRPLRCSEEHEASDFISLFFCLFHTCSGTFCHVFIGFFLIQTFCLFLGPVSHLHHLTPSSLLTTCHTDRCSTYSTKALVSRFTFMYNSEPTFTLLMIPTFQCCPVPLFGARTQNPLSNYDLYCNWPVEDTFFPSLCKFLWNLGHFNVGGGSSVHIYVSVLSDAVKDTSRCFEHVPYFCECFESSIYLLVQ